MDSALFMERYGYKILLLILIGGAFAFVFGFVGYAVFYWFKRGGFILVILFGLIMVMWATFGRLLDFVTSVRGRLSYINKAKFFESKKDLERERERIREEGGKLY